MFGIKIPLWIPAFIYQHKCLSSPGFWGDKYNIHNLIRTPHMEGEHHMKIDNTFRENPLLTLTLKDVYLQENNRSRKLFYF
jgi:hypothetical protein